MTKNGKAQISDYGLSPIILDPRFTIEASSGVAGPSRWYAPEIIVSLNKRCSEPPTASEPVDIFAFAMLSVEVFTGNVPFGNMRNKFVDVQIVDGKRPNRPQAGEQVGLTEEMWKSIGKCWTEDPNKRPVIDEVVRAWDGFVSEYVASRSASPATRRTAPRENGWTLVPRISRRQSQFAGTSTTLATQPCKPSPCRAVLRLTG